MDEVVIEDGRAVGIKGRSTGGGALTERAPLVIGADGRYSLVAEAVQPEQYNDKPPLLAAYYTYWSGLPIEGRFETYVRDRRGFAAAPTHDGLTLTVGGWPYAEFEANKRDVEVNFLKMLDLVPEFAERIRGARLRLRSARGREQLLRKPYCPGWASSAMRDTTRTRIRRGNQRCLPRRRAVCGGGGPAFTGARSFRTRRWGNHTRSRPSTFLPM